MLPPYMTRRRLAFPAPSPQWYGLWYGLVAGEPGGGWRVR